MTIDLPMPPSTNAIWRAVGNGMRRSAEYRRWRKACNQLALIGKWHKTPVRGAYDLTITLDRSQCGKGSDLGNREKAVSDLLQAIGVIDDDNLAERILLQWGEAPLGARVLVEPADRTGRAG